MYFINYFTVERFFLLLFSFSMQKKIKTRSMRNVRNIDIINLFPSLIFSPSPTLFSHIRHSFIVNQAFLTVSFFVKNWELFHLRWPGGLPPDQTFLHHWRRSLQGCHHYHNLSIKKHVKECFFAEHLCKRC